MKYKDDTRQTPKCISEVSNLGQNPLDCNARPRADDRGRIYGGLIDGRIVRFSPGLRSWETFADTGGRPLGLDFDQSGNLIVADAFRGLLSVDPGGDIAVLASQAGGVPFGLTDDVDVAADGLIYFTDASWRHSLATYKLDALEHRPHGRLLTHDRDSGTTDVLLDGLHFANGVAVNPSNDFVLVNETWEYRVTRYWLSGPKAGMKHFLLTLALVFSLPATAAGDHDALQALLDEFLAGASVNDAAMHERFWADDLVYTSSSGERFGKTEIMAGLAEPGDSAEASEAETPSYSAQDVNIRSFGKTAVITFRLVAEHDDQARTEYFNTGVFRCREGRWRAVSWQATRIGDFTPGSPHGPTQAAPEGPQ